MEPKSIIVNADSLEHAINKGCKELGVSKKDIKYEVLEEPKKSILGKSSGNYKVRMITVKKERSSRSDNIIQDIVHEADNADGYFKLHYKDGYATLTVFPPKGQGNPVYTEEIMNRMKLLDIPRVSIIKIDEIISEASGKPVNLVKWSAGVELGATIEITTSDDKMKATAFLKPPKKGGAEMTKNQVMKILEEMNITYGIDEGAIESLVGNPLYNEDVVIVRGKEPVQGRGASIKYNFNTSPGKPFKEDEFGRINLKELDFIQNKNSGDILAELLPPSPGIPGFNIHGEKLTAVISEPEVLVPGDNTALSSDGKKLIAIIDGCVTLQKGIVNLQPLVTVEKVDYQTGNLEANGSVLVRDTIADGFSVTAAGSVQVGNYVGKAIIKAEGDVILKAGINGNNEGSIEAEGEIYARYIEGTNVKCGAHLFVEEAIMHSNISVWGNVMFMGKRGELIGGSSVIGGMLWCKKLGSINGVKTTISMGIDPEKLELLDQLQTTISAKKDSRTEITDKMQRVEKYISSQNPVEEKITITYQKLKELEKRLTDEINHLEQEAREISHFLFPSPDSIIVLEDTAYEGVIINYGKEDFRVPPTDINRTVFKYLNKTITEKGFNPADPPKVKFKTKHKPKPEEDKEESTDKKSEEN